MPCDRRGIGCCIVEAPRSVYRFLAASPQREYVKPMPAVPERHFSEAVGIRERIVITLCGISNLLCAAAGRSASLRANFRCMVCGAIVLDILIIRAHNTFILWLRV